MIIGISGKARSGKDQFAEYLIEAFSKEYGREFKTTAFAHELKRICLRHFNLSREQLWGHDKERMTSYGKNEMGRHGISSNPADYWTSREIMQAVGSFYRSIDYDFWVRKVDEKWKYANCPDLVITDVRHINECEYVKKNGMLVKVIRNSTDEIHGMDHESETALDGKPDDYFDIIIHNDGTLDDLKIAAEGATKYIMSLQNFKEKEILRNV